MVRLCIQNQTKPNLYGKRNYGNRLDKERTWPAHHFPNIGGVLLPSPEQGTHTSWETGVGGGSDDLGMCLNPEASC